jgi:hypothetical protein
MVGIDTAGCAVLEGLVEKHGLSGVVAVLSDICSVKVEEAEMPLKEGWIMLSRAFYLLIDTCHKYKLPGVER